MTTGSVKVSYGQRNLIDVQAMADVALVNDYLFMRISGVSHQQDGYVTRIDYGCAFPTSGIPAVGGLQQDCVSGKEGGKNYQGGRVALRWLPAENFEANLTADVTIDKSETAGGHAARSQSRAGGSDFYQLGVPARQRGRGGLRQSLRSEQSLHQLCGLLRCGSGGQHVLFLAGYATTSNWGTNLTLDWKLAPESGAEVDHRLPRIRHPLDRGQRRLAAVRDPSAPSTCSTTR